MRFTAVFPDHSGWLQAGGGLNCPICQISGQHRLSYHLAGTHTLDTSARPSPSPGASVPGPAASPIETVFAPGVGSEPQRRRQAVARQLGPTQSVWPTERSARQLDDWNRSGGAMRCVTPTLGGRPLQRWHSLARRAESDVSHYCCCVGLTGQGSPPIFLGPGRAAPAARLDQVPVPLPPGQTVPAPPRVHSWCRENADPQGPDGPLCLESR